MGATDPARVAQLETVFETIQYTRMADVPLLNPVLRVEAVGFRPWAGGDLGVLITPWFLSLLWLAGDPETPLAATLSVTLPSGEYAFLSAWEPVLGAYASCSLISPVLMFADQATIQITARTVLETVFEETTAPRGLSRRRLLTGA